MLDTIRYQEECAILVPTPRFSALLNIARLLAQALWNCLITRNNA
jgi:hypothetical protein